MSNLSKTEPENLLYKEQNKVTSNLQQQQQPPVTSQQQLQQHQQKYNDIRNFDISMSRMRTDTQTMNDFYALHKKYRNKGYGINLSEYLFAGFLSLYLKSVEKAITQNIEMKDNNGLFFKVQELLKEFAKEMTDEKYVLKVNKKLELHPYYKDYFGDIEVKFIDAFENKRGSMSPLKPLTAESLNDNDSKVDNNNNKSKKYSPTEDMEVMDEAMGIKSSDYIRKILEIVGKIVDKHSGDSPAKSYEYIVKNKEGKDEPKQLTLDEPTDVLIALIIVTNLNTSFNNYFFKKKLEEDDMELLLHELDTLLSSNLSDIEPEIFDYIDNVIGDINVNDYNQINYDNFERLQYYIDFKPYRATLDDSYTEEDINIILGRDIVLDIILLGIVAQIRKLGGVKMDGENEVSYRYHYTEVSNINAPQTTEHYNKLPEQVGKLLQVILKELTNPIGNKYKFKVNNKVYQLIKFKDKMVETRDKYYAEKLEYAKDNDEEKRKIEDMKKNDWIYNRLSAAYSGVVEEAPKEEAETKEEPVVAKEPEESNEEEVENTVNETVAKEEAKEAPK